MCAVLCAVPPQGHHKATGRFSDVGSPFVDSRSPVFLLAGGVSCHAQEAAGMFAWRRVL